jgi:metal-responsive CopG/Arc/MetJ family transcriptional regulator
VIGISQTIGIYLSDEEEEDLLPRIEKIRKHISRSGWIKQAIEKQLKEEEKKEK